MYINHSPSYVAGKQKKKPHSSPSPPPCPSPAVSHAPSSFGTLFLGMLRMERVSSEGTELWGRLSLLEALAIIPGRYLGSSPERCISRSVGQCFSRCGVEVGPGAPVWDGPLPSAGTRTSMNPCALVSCSVDVLGACENPDVAAVGEGGGLTAVSRPWPWPTAVSSGSVYLVILQPN